MIGLFKAIRDFSPEKESSFYHFVQLEHLLSLMEKRVCDLYLQGMDYRQIAGYLEKSPKSIDNALKRIRKKISIMNTICAI